jgi:TldD protein
MSNTYFGRGTTPVPEMIASVKRGIYLQKGMSGMEDPKNWGLQLIIHYGREIVDGKLTGRVFSPIGVTGYVPDLLQSISQVGDDFFIEGGGMCGKAYKEFVFVGSGGPHLKLRARLG